MAWVEANLTKRRRSLLLLALFGLGLVCLAVPIAAESGVATAWVRTYNGPANGWDEAKAMVLDSQGNICVTGFSERSEDRIHYLTIKYSPKGKRLWARLYDGPGKKRYHGDWARAISLDRHDNIYVTGSSMAASGYGWATIKYSPKGVCLWVSRYEQSFSFYTSPVSLAVDGQGNVYVTGSSDVPGGVNGGNTDYTTIKYGPDGRELWVRSYNGPEHSIDLVTALALDNQGNVYVTGSSYSFETHHDYLTIKYSPEGEELWVRRYNGPGSKGTNHNSAGDYPRAIAVDGQGNILVTGESVMQSYEKTNYRDSSYLTVKYDPNGQLLWAQHYAGGTGKDLNNATAMALDVHGNAYVTGQKGIYFDTEFQTIKYDPDGQLIWTQQCTGNGAQAIALDTHGGVYVTSSYFFTVKYNSEGELIWTRPFNGPGLFWPIALAVDALGNVYVTCRDWITIKHIQSPRTGR